MDSGQLFPDGLAYLDELGYSATCRPGQRFTDLMDRLGGITPRTLTQRLRDLESDGLVLVDREPGRREVCIASLPPASTSRPPWTNSRCGACAISPRPPRRANQPIPSTCSALCASSWPASGSMSARSPG
ncbi:winged helix-turn-helix transcriptional regulator [Protofrankia symbiont of Coriaria ruscifolia]|uniref:winged helix-turn-helix transcriptional regulator n=1 Tax=Protofrankia symbiont of Coriaria ruscifolia TaxID=1306542 RepID=UPI002414E3F8|nr:winged helix-turn-helix transcriptional regulator [Protofrankia symbiont of Coriaria ruscifolia]